MQFYFIRHGQSENNRLWALTGSWEGRSDDPDLTSLGRRQAEELARFLRQPGQPVAGPDPIWDAQNVGGFGLTHLYCSLMVRAVATGAILARALGLPLVAWEEAHEVGGINRRNDETGERVGLPGPNRAFFEEYHPDLVLPDSLGDEGWWNRPHEEREQRPLRARRFLDELFARHGDSDDRVALVSHGGFHGHVMRVLLDIPQEIDCWFALNNAALTRVDFGEEFNSVQYLNRIDYMPRKMVT